MEETDIFALTIIAVIFSFFGVFTVGLIIMLVFGKIAGLVALTVLFFAIVAACIIKIKKLSRSKAGG